MAITASPGTAYVWDLSDLAQSDWGVITVTAKTNSTLSWPPSITLTNLVTISTTTIEAMPGSPNSASVAFTVQTADPQIRKTVFPMWTLSTGDWLTFTLVYSNAGPAAASGVVITDLLSSKLLTNTATFTYTTSYIATLTASDHFVWQVGGACGWLGHHHGDSAAFHSPGRFDAQPGDNHCAAVRLNPLFADRDAQRKHTLVQRSHPIRPEGQAVVFAKFFRQRGV